MGVAHVVGALVAREGNPGSVDDDHEVTTIDVRRVGRLVLAAQQRGDLGGQTTEDNVFSIDHMPVPGEIARLWGVRGHSNFHSLSNT